LAQKLVEKEMHCARAKGSNRPTVKQLVGNTRNPRYKALGNPP
jgi:hypothetical protein